MKWEKKGQIYIPPGIGVGPPHLQTFAQAPNVLVGSNSVRVFFTSRAPKDANGQYVSRVNYIDYESFEPIAIGEKSTEPILSLGKIGEFDEFGTYPFSVLEHKDEYLAFYGGWTRCESVPFEVSIGLAKSTDGKYFDRVGTGPVLTKSLNEPYVITSPKIRFYNSKFYLFYTAGTKWFEHDGKSEITYKIRFATSNNGIDWVKGGRDIITDSILDEAQACPDVFYFNGRYHMFFCYRGSINFRSGGDAAYQIGYAYSDDLEIWHRRDDLVDLTISKTGWDSEMVSYPTVFEFKDSIYMIYLGNSVGITGMGLAKLEGTL
jgi:predicted GH43/DUF377 family glycosyl hydrolase